MELRIACVKQMSISLNMRKFGNWIKFIHRDRQCYVVTYIKLVIEMVDDHGKNIQHYDFYIFDSKKGINQNRGSLEVMQVNERIFVLLSHLTSVFGLVFVHNCVGMPNQIEIVTP